MFLGRYMEEIEDDISKIKPKYVYENSYQGRYDYWRDYLFNIISKLFKWDGLPATIPERQLELILGVMGQSCIGLHKDGSLIAMRGTYSTPKYYEEEYTKFCASSPDFSKVFTIDEDCVIIRNNAYDMPYIEHIENYASILAHIDVTITFTLIQARDNGGVPTAKTERQKQSMLDYQSKIFNGYLGVVSDIGDIGVSYEGTNRGNYQHIESLIIARERILRDFKTEMGIKSVFDKTSIAISPEIDGNDTMLQYNLDLMLSERKKGAEKVNKMFGTNISVEINPKLDDEEKKDEVENERRELSDSTDTAERDELQQRKDDSE